MPRLARCRILVSALTILIGTPWLLMAADGAVGVHPSAAGSYILIGFAGGFVRHNNPNHGPVKLAQRIRLGLPQGDLSRCLRTGTARMRIKPFCGCSIAIVMAF